MRLPFLDPEVVRLGLGSGWLAGFRDGWTKRALRRAAAHRLPDEIVWRREKTAYEVPDANWLARPDVQARLADSGRILFDAGLAARPDGSGLRPWRVIAFAAFIEGYGLTP